jgi:PGF-CTERM protein
MTDRTGTLARTVTLLVVAAVVATAATSATAAAAVADADGQADAPEPSLYVDLNADGSARVRLTLTYDLDDEDEATAFRSLRNDAETKRDTKRRFHDRMRSVAADSSNVTGRAMSVTDPAIEVTTTDGVGVVRLSVTWNGLAATGDGKLVVTEPFASGFETDRRVVVEVPDGYGVESASPGADATGDGRRVWAAGTDLTGFRLVASTGAGGTATGDAVDDTGRLVPGFGPLAALLALAGAVLLFRRRR